MRDRGGPRDSRWVKAPDHLNVRHYKGDRLSAIRTGRLYPRRNPWYSFSEADSTSGHMVWSEGTMEKIPSDTTGNRSRDRPTSSTAPYPLRYPRPHLLWGILRKFQFKCVKTTATTDIVTRISMLNGSLSQWTVCPHGAYGEDGLQVWRVAAIIFNKELWIPEKWLSSSLEVGQVANSSSP